MVCGFLRRCCAPLPQRGVVATIVMTGLAVQYFHRQALNLAITVIAFQLERDDRPNSGTCEVPNATEIQRIKDESKAEFHWDIHDQANILGAFFIGYCITQVPFGIIGDIFGPKKVLGYGVLLSALCSALTPISARIHIYALIAVRLFMGLAQGPLFPAVSSFNARWALPVERALFSSYMNSGVVLGSILSNAITGVLLNYLEHWDHLFYLYAIFTLIWYVAWLILAYDSVETHPFITETEKDKISAALGDELDVNNFKVPYYSITTSVPVWAMIIGNLGNDLVFYIIVVLLPQYLSYVLHFDAESNGLINTLPYIALVMVSLPSSKLAEIILKRGYMSKTAQNKLYLFFANLCPCIGLILGSYAGCNRILAVSMFILGFGSLGTIYSSVRMCNVDMAPNFAGTLMAFMNGIGSVAGVFIPQLFAFFVTEQTVAGWRNGFFASSAIVLVTTVFFWIFGTSKLQSWNFPPKTEDVTITDEVFEDAEVKE